MAEISSKWFKWVFLTTGLLGTALFAFTLPPWQVLGVVLLASNLALPIVQKAAKERAETSEAVSAVDIVQPSLPLVKDRAEPTRAGAQFADAIHLFESVLDAYGETSLARQVDIASMSRRWTQIAASLQLEIPLEDIPYWRTERITLTVLARKLIPIDVLRAIEDISMVYTSHVPVEQLVGETRRVNTWKEESRWAVENW